MKVFSAQYFSGRGWSAQLPKWDSQSTLIIAFAAPEMADDQTWFNDLKAQFPNSVITGCSTAGEIFGESIDDNSVSIAITRFEKTRLTVSSAKISSASNSIAAGEVLARPHIDADLKALFVISEGLNVNGSALVKGIGQVVSPSTIVTGGLAADGPNFKKTWVIHGDQIVSGVVTAVGFHGDAVHFSHGSQGGWQIFGPERHITRSKGSVLYELDGQPALDLYKQYLGELANELPSSGLLFPLQIRDKKNLGKPLVRTILATDEKEKSMTFAGDLPEGWTAQLMRANFESLVDGASGAASQTSIEDHHGPTLAIAISCVGRRLVLRERAEEEVEATLEKLPAETLQVGFYSYGEICPFEKLLNCELHNQTMTLTTIWEAA